MKTITLEVDQDDFDAIQSAVCRRQAVQCLPDGILTKESLFSKYGTKVFIPGSGIFLYYKWLNNE